jgi:hypothetical protein
MQVDNRMPLEVLSPPNGLAVRAPADTVKVR